MGLDNPKITTDVTSGTLAVDLATVRTQLRLSTGEAPDAELGPIIEAVTRRLEDDLGRSFLTKTWTWKLDRFAPGRDPNDDFYYQSVARASRRSGGATIEVPRPPLVAITSIKYTDTDGTEQTVSTDDYQVDTFSTPGRIAPSASAAAWPSNIGIDYLNPVEITYTAGYGDAETNVPYPIRHAIIMYVGHFWENREASIAIPLSEVDPGAWSMVASFKIQRW